MPSNKIELTARDRCPRGLTVVPSRHDCRTCENFKGDTIVTTDSGRYDGVICNFGKPVSSRKVELPVRVIVSSKRLFDVLTKKQYEIAMCFCEGHNYAETAKQLGTNPPSVRQSLFASYQKIKTLVFYEVPVKSPKPHEVRAVLAGYFKTHNPTMKFTLPTKVLRVNRMPNTKTHMKGSGKGEQGVVGELVKINDSLRILNSLMKQIKFILEEKQ